MSADKRIEFSAADFVPLNAAPINPDWVLEGKPVARNAALSRSEDGFATTVIWDCTAGVFNWFYDIDETVYVLEGSVTIEDGDGKVRALNGGDAAYFPAGSSAKWTVENYVRKVAFCRRPVPRGLAMARKVAKAVAYGVGLRKPAVAAGGGLMG